MSDAARFRLLEAGTTVRIRFDGRDLEVPADASVAAALLAAGVARFRNTPVGNEPRAPYCMMGVCFECLVDIDGEPNRQACMTPVQDGMQVRTQHGARSIAGEVPADGR